MSQSPTQYLLDASKMPKHWYNIAADLPVPAPAVLHPGTMQPVGPDDLAPLFPMELIMQEVSTEREIPIPEPVREVFKLWRPAPLFRAHCLEKALGTPAKIYYKYEGVSPAGSHKPNTAVPQAWYNAQAGVKKLILFHHDPDHNDRKVDAFLKHARALVKKQSGKLKVEAAREGMTIQLGGKSSR